MQQPVTQSVLELFNSRIQFQIPVYQRAYVWNEEDNWAAMWEDISDTARRYLENPDGHMGHRHFLGPIVLRQEHFEPGGVDPRTVIDGQQRLTTLQILLTASVAVAAERDAEETVRDLRDLTVNRGAAVAGDLTFKVWPARRDRASFLATMRGEIDGATGAIPAGFVYFRDSIEAWVTDEGDADDDEQSRRLEALRATLESLLYVVSINLDDTDNAQVIFETLNARGTGLGALDLVKNAVFLQAEREGAPAEELYDGQWEPVFEAGGDEYWQEESRQGRTKRARADWFLMHWLAMELGEVVRADTLFDTFRKDVLHRPSPPPIKELVPTICNDARIIRSFDDFEPGTPEELFFARMQTLDTTTMLPIALFLFRTPEVSSEERQSALLALESWLVRRAIVKQTSKNYNRTLTSLIRALKKHADHADSAIVSILRASQANTAVWPSDDDVLEVLREHDLYGRMKNKGQVRMLLEACELDVRDSSKTEAITLPSGLSIEHALPQSWEEHWPASGPDPELAAEFRQAHVNRLGNLTLVTQPLNSSLSNAPWLERDDRPHSKRKELQKRSVLLINQQLCAHESWNEELIDNRGEELARRIVRTWPGPDSEDWPEPVPELVDEAEKSS